MALSDFKLRARVYAADVERHCMNKPFHDDVSLAFAQGKLVGALRAVADILGMDFATDLQDELKKEFPKMEL